MTATSVERHFSVVTVLVLTGCVRLASPFGDVDDPPDARRPVGATCDAPEACLSGVCADGLCCADTCLPSESCATPGAPGECRPRPPGAACSVDSACPTGHCVLGICCDSACTGLCDSCALPSSPGICARVPDNQDPDGDCPGACNACFNAACAPADVATNPEHECGAGLACGVDGTCAVEAGGPCTGDAECATGFCLAGVCLGGRAQDVAGAADTTSLDLLDLQVRRDGVPCVLLEEKIDTGLPVEAVTDLYEFSILERRLVLACLEQGVWLRTVLLAQPVVQGTDESRFTFDLFRLSRPAQIVVTASGIVVVLDNSGELLPDVRRAPECHVAALWFGPGLRRGAVRCLDVGLPASHFLGWHAFADDGAGGLDGVVTHAPYGDPSAPRVLWRVRCPLGVCARHTDADEVQPVDVDYAGASLGLDGRVVHFALAADLGHLLVLDGDGPPVNAPLPAACAVSVLPAFDTDIFRHVVAAAAIDVEGRSLAHVTVLCGGPVASLVYDPQSRQVVDGTMVQGVRQAFDAVPVPLPGSPRALAVMTPTTVMMWHHDADGVLHEDLADADFAVDDFADTRLGALAGTTFDRLPRLAWQRDVIQNFPSPSGEFGDVVNRERHAVRFRSYAP